MGFATKNTKATKKNWTEPTPCLVPFVFFVARFLLIPCGGLFGLGPDAVGDALVPEHLEGQPAKALAVPPVPVPVHPQLVVDELVLEDPELDLFGIVAVHSADLLGPGPVPAAQQGDAEADLRVPLAPGVLD